MEELIEIARACMGARIYNVTLDMDFDQLEAHKASVLAYMEKTGAVVMLGEKMEYGSPPVVYLQIYAVKIVLECRNIWIEKNEKNN